MCEATSIDDCMVHINVKGDAELAISRIKSGVSTRKNELQELLANRRSGENTMKDQGCICRLTDVMEEIDEAIRQLQ